MPTDWKTPQYLAPGRTLRFGRTPRGRWLFEITKDGKSDVAMSGFASKKEARKVAEETWKRIRGAA